MISGRASLWVFFIGDSVQRRSGNSDVLNICDITSTNNHQENLSEICDFSSR